MSFWSKRSDLRLTLAANPKLIKDRVLLKTTCHFTFQTLTFHSYTKPEFKNVREIAVKSAVKVNKRNTGPTEISRSDLNWHRSPHLCLQKPGLNPDSHTGQGGSGSCNGNIRRALLGPSSYGHRKTICWLEYSPVIVFWQTAVLILLLMRRYGEVLYIMRIFRSNVQNEADVKRLD